MDQHQAGLEEALMEVRVLTQGSEAVERPAASRCCWKCVLSVASVMGLLVVALLVGFILYLFVFSPSCNQETFGEGHRGKVNITCTLKRSEQEGKYNIFTTKKPAYYLIYGWVKGSDGASGEITLKQTWNNTTNTLETKAADGKETFFFKSTKLRTNTEISIFFSFQYSDGSFHVYEL